MQSSSSSAPLFFQPLPGASLWLWPLGTPSAPLVKEEELLLRAGLTTPEEECLTGLTPPARRLEWLAARVMAREKFQAKVGYDPSGKPLLLPLAAGTTSLPAVSISHTQGYAALMAAGSPCGTDIEPLSRCASHVATRIASAPELRMAGYLFPANPELLLWCAKETAYKATRSEGADLRQDITVAEGERQKLLILTPAGSVEAEFSVYEDLLIVCGQLLR